MPAPSNANALSLGRPMLDLSAFDATNPEHIHILAEKVALVLMGMGWPCDAQAAGDAQYMSVYAQDDGMGAHNLYGGNPTDPLNPTVLTVSAAGSATVIVQEEGSTVGTRGTLNFIGSTVTAVDNSGSNRVDITVTAGGGAVSEAFKTISVSGQSDVVADSATDTLTLAAGSGIAITTDAGTDTVTIAASGLPTAAFTKIAVSGQSDVDADSASDTLTLVAGSNMTITTNAAGDSITFASSGGGSVTAGTYIDVSGSTVSVDLTEVSGYSGATTQLLGHVSGTFQFKTIADWLKLLASYSGSSIQSIGHDSGADPTWQTDGVCS